MSVTKEKTVFVCRECGFDSPKWTGKCPSCGMWNTMVEKTIRVEKPSATVSLRKSASGKADGTPHPETLDTIETTEEPRIDISLPIISIITLQKYSPARVHGYANE